MKTSLSFLLFIGMLIAAVTPAYSITAQDYFNRGIARAKNSDFDGAIADFTKAATLRPEFAEARTNLAIAYYNRGSGLQRRGELDGAISDYTKAIQVQPNFATAYSNRGTVRGSKGDFDGAIADFTKAIALKPDYAEAKANLAIAMKARVGSTGSNSGGANGNQPQTTTPSTNVRAVGWIDQVNQAHTTSDLSSAKPDVASPWHSDFVLRCSDGHDYLLARTAASIMPKTLTFGPDSLYEVEGRLRETSPDYLRSHPFIARVMNGTGMVVKMETRDVSRTIVVQSIKQAQ